MVKNEEAKINLMNIIKTAIITIMISFASGLLLNYFTNLGPRILCNVRNGKPKKIGDKENFAYIVTVKNPSKKTIHELTVHIQNSQANLKSTDFKITKGLKFDSNIEDNVLEVYIPFLSKGDEFSVKVYLENQDEVQKKPIVVIRSPENFKEIDSSKQNGILLALVNIPKNIEQVMNKVTGKGQPTNNANRQAFSGNKPVSKNKKVIIIIVLFVLIVIAGVSAELYFKGGTTNTSTNTSTNATKQSTGSKGSGANAATDADNSASGTNAATGTGTNSKTDTKGAGTNAATGAGSSETTNAATGTGSSQTTNSASGTGGSGAGTNTTKGAGSSEKTNTTTPTTNTNTTTAPTAPATTDPAGAATNATTSK